MVYGYAIVQYYFIYDIFYSLMHVVVRKPNLVQFKCFYLFIFKLFAVIVMRGLSANGFINILGIAVVESGFTYLITTPRSNILLEDMLISEMTIFQLTDRT